MGTKNGIQNAETRADLNENSLPEAAHTPETKSNTTKSDSRGLKNAGIGVAGGVVGAAGVAGAASLMGFTTPESAPELDSETSGASTHAHTPSVENFDGDNVPVAHNVSDDMSFNEAFAAGRSETGAGGVFFWRGGVYGTYYRNEWNNLPADYKDTFSNFPYHQPEDSLASHDTPVDEPIAGTNQETHTVDENLSNGEADPAEAVAVDEVQIDATIEDVTIEDATIENAPVESSQNEDVEILGIQYTEFDGEEIAIAHVTVDGEDNLFIDMDTDGIFDVVATENGDLFDISEHNITYADVADFQEETQGTIETDYLSDNDLPDYTNDAPIDNFIA
jgi:hypothetical protein